MIIIKHQEAVRAISHLPGWMMGTISVALWVQGHRDAERQDLRCKTAPWKSYHKVSWVFTAKHNHCDSIAVCFSDCESENVRLSKRQL